MWSFNDYCRYFVGYTPPRYPRELLDVKYDPDFAIRGLGFDSSRGFLMRLDMVSWWYTCIPMISFHIICMYNVYVHTVTRISLLLFTSSRLTTSTRGTSFSVSDEPLLTSLKRPTATWHMWGGGGVSWLYITHSDRDKSWLICSVIDLSYDRLLGKGLTQFGVTGVNWPCEYQYFACLVNINFCWSFFRKWNPTSYIHDDKDFFLSEARMMILNSQVYTVPSLKVAASSPYSLLLTNFLGWRVSNVVFLRYLRFGEGVLEGWESVLKAGCCFIIFYGCGAAVFKLHFLEWHIFYTLTSLSFSVQCCLINKEATYLGFVCFVVINPCVLSASRVDLGFFFCFINFPIYPPPPVLSCRIRPPRLGHRSLLNEWYRVPPSVRLWGCCVLGSPHSSQVRGKGCLVCGSTSLTLYSLLTHCTVPSISC